MNNRLNSLVFIGMLVSSVCSAETNVDLNVHIGTPPAVIIREPSEHHPPHEIVDIEEEPEFIFPSQLGFYVAIGVPYDLFYLNGYFWLYRDNLWHRGVSHTGPWVRYKVKHVPWGIRRHRIVKIREYREHEYREYLREKEHYRGKKFRPDHSWKEEQHHKRKEHHKKDKGKKGSHDDRGNRGHER